MVKELDIDPDVIHNRCCNSKADDPEY